MYSWILFSHYTSFTKPTKEPRRLVSHPKQLSGLSPSFTQILVSGSSKMDEEFTICGKCGKQVPPSQFCIYCGYNLLKDRGKIQQSWEKPEEPQQFEPPAPVPIPSPEENSFSRPLAEGTIPQYTVIPLTESTSEAQVTQAWSELLENQARHHLHGGRNSDPGLHKDLGGLRKRSSEATREDR